MILPMWSQYDVCNTDGAVGDKVCVYIANQRGVKNYPTQLGVRGPLRYILNVFLHNWLAIQLSHLKLRFLPLLYSYTMTIDKTPVKEADICAIKIK